MKTSEGPEELLERVRVIVCVGTGGVGKTTVAASIALEAARRGARALVLTIDPARRLADALGVDELGNRPSELPEAMRETLGIHGDGRLFAMMLDMKQTFDDLVDRFAPDKETHDRILANPIYQHVSDALAGSGEYAAMEKLYEMSESHDFDLIVLDTPPSQHALDFLEAPQRLLDFLDSRLVKLLVHPAFSAGRFGLKVFQGGTQRLFQLLEKVSGITFLEDVSQFLLAFETMTAGFRERADRVQSLLLGPETGFLLVAGPSPGAARGGYDFISHLERHRVDLRGIVVNRMRLWPDDAPPPESLTETRSARIDAEAAAAPSATLESDITALATALGSERGEACARAAAAIAREYACLVRLDENSTAPLREHALKKRIFFRTVPELPRDVHDVSGLSAIVSHLFAPVAPEPGEPTAPPND